MGNMNREMVVDDIRSFNDRESNVIRNLFEIVDDSDCGDEYCGVENAIYCGNRGAHMYFSENPQIDPTYISTCIYGEYFPELPEGLNYTDSQAIIRMIYAERKERARELINNWEIL